MKLKLKDKTYDINVSDWGESIKVVIDDKEYFFVPGPRGKLIPKKETESN